MKNLCQRFFSWIVFTFFNPVLFKDEFGGFKVVFRKFCMDISTMSGNFKTRIMISEHPYGYLFYSFKQGKMNNIRGYCRTLYSVATMLTTDQKLVNEVQRSIQRCLNRQVINPQTQEQAVERDDEAALTEVQAEQEFSLLSRRQRKKAYREFKKEQKNGRTQNH